MKNARRILSLVLSFLMVFGSVATLLPTTVMAAEQAGELSVTFIDESENTIAVIPFNGTTTIKGLLEGDSADVAKVKKATAQTDTKVFIGWTNTDGTAVDTTAVITESITVKADVSAYILYTWADLLKERKAGNFKINACTALNIETDLNVQLGSRSASFEFHGIDLALDDYEAFVAKYSTNASNYANKNVPFVRVYDKQTGKEVEVTSNYSGSSTKYITYTCSPTQATADGTGVDDIRAVFPLYCVPESVTGISGIKLAPLAAASSPGLVYPAPDGKYDFTKTWFDIEYFAFFEKEAAVELFDYSKYGFYDVTFTDEKDNIITTISAKGTDTLGALINANPDAKALIDAATAQTDTKVFMGWMLPDETAVDNSTVITESTTLKAMSSAYKLYTPAEILAGFDSGSIETSRFSNIKAVSYKVDEGNRTFLHLEARSSGSHMFEWTFDPVLSGYEAVVVPHITNTTFTTLSQSSFVQTMATANGTYGTAVQYKKTSTNIVESTDEAGNITVSGIDDIDAVYPISGNIGKLKFAPWRGKTIYGSTATCIGPAKISGVGNDAYVDIEYIAFFEKEEAVGNFEYSLYGKAEYDVNIIGYGSETPVLAKIQKNKPIPVDGIATQYVNDSGTLMVISGWEIDGKTYSVDSYLVSGSCTVTAVYAPAYIVTEANSTLNGGLRSGSQGINAPVKLEENGIFYQHFSTIKGVKTADISQLSFKIGVGPVLHSANPYISYSYRTNITPEGNTWTTAYSITNFGAVYKEDGTKYTGTAKFGQLVEDIVSDGTWNIATHKAESFGAYPDEEKFADASWALNQLYLAPWRAISDIEIEDEQYIDIQYIGFFPSETAANNFDIDSYLDYFMVNVTVEVDGAKNKALSGEYFEGTVIELPDTSGVAGYLYNGMIVMSVNVPEDEDGDGEVTISVASRKVNAENYIHRRGELDNLKKAGEDGTINVVYIGGSATAGTGSSNKAFSWAGLTTKYLKTKFVTVDAVNEALGGHGSRSAAFRLQKDVIAHNPDIVFIETSMNDHYDGDMVGDVYNGKYYEYIIRTIREELPNTEIVTVYLVNNGLVKKADGTLRDDKHPAAAAQDVIADHYDISSIDVGRYAFEAIFGADGKYSTAEWKKYYQDSVHPLDSGYALYAKAIREYLEVALEVETPEEFVDEELPADAIYPASKAFTPSVIDLKDEAVTVDGMTFVDSKKSSTFQYYLKTTENPGSGTISFSFTGTELGFYMTMPGDNFDAETDGELDENATGKVTVTIDGVNYTEIPSIKSPFMYGLNLENKEHNVTLTLNGVDNTECIVYGILVGTTEKLTPAKLVATVEKGSSGSFTINGEAPKNYYDEYVSATEKVELTAQTEDQAFAYWKRYTNEDEITEVLVGTEATVNVYALGGNVYYQPVFVDVGTNVSLYIDKATKEILAVGDAPEGYTPDENETLSTDVVTVYDCTKSVEDENNNTFTVYELGNETPVEIPEELANPAFGASVAINKSDENTAPKWTVELGEKVYTASYKDRFLFSYMFEAGTEVVVRENQLAKGETATPAISTVAVWDETNSETRTITRFTGLFALPEGYTLVNHGVMMSQVKSDLEALVNNRDGVLDVTDTTIIGRISDNSENASPLFTIAKRLSLGTENWYGRAFLVYTDGTTTYVVYADDTISTGYGEGAVEAEYNYNPEVYNPMYWDDTVVIPAV